MLSEALAQAGCGRIRRCIPELLWLSLCWPASASKNACRTGLFSKSARCRGGTVHVLADQMQGPLCLGLATDEPELQPAGHRRITRSSRRATLARQTGAPGRDLLERYGRRQKRAGCRRRYLQRTSLRLASGPSKQLVVRIVGWASAADKKHREENVRLRWQGCACPAQVPA